MSWSSATRRHLSLTIVHALVILLALTCIVPFLWMLSSSLQDITALFRLPPSFVPRPARWGNYAEVFYYLPMLRIIGNTLFTTIARTVGTVFACSLAAYAFARLQWKGRTFVFTLYLATMMIPGQVTLIPTFALMSLFGWINTFWALIVPGVFGNPYGTFLLRQFFMTIPKELSEAAIMDGCGHAYIYASIILPLSKAALATLSVFTILWNWNDFMWPLVVTNSLDMKTLTAGLALLTGSATISARWDLIMSGTVISVLPMVIVFLAAQRYFVQGVVLTGLKG